MTVPSSVVVTLRSVRGIGNGLKVHGRLVKKTVNIELDLIKKSS